jgi:two-component system sensor histidine kinase VicK
MTHTIETLLDLYKIEAGMVELKKSPCDIVKLINAKMDEFKVLLDKNGIRIERGIPFKGLQVNIDEGKIKEAIGNILSNAIKFTPENGQVKVGISVDKSFIRIEFSNNSENIPSEKLSVIFEKFKRLDEATEGTGLGLAIAKDIVELHGGDIWAENLHGKGVKFIVVLPLS